MAGVRPQEPRVYVITPVSAVCNWVNPRQAACALQDADHGRPNQKPRDGKLSASAQQLMIKSGRATCSWYTDGDARCFSS